MQELKQFSSDYHSGLYVDTWVDKSLFLEALLKHPQVIEYLEGWQEEVRPTITVDCIEHCWIIFDNIKFDYEPIPFNQAGEPVTFYYFWIYE